MIQNLNDIAVRPRRVIILGGSGFIGCALKDYLQSSACSVLCLSSKEIDLSSDTAATQLATIVLPTDAVVFLSVVGPNRVFDTTALIKNLRMAENVVLALNQAPCAHLIYASSEAVYGSEQENITNQSIAAPDTMYGVMHLARELILKQLTTIPLLILRINQVYGSGCTHNAYGPNRFIRSAQQACKIELFGNGEELRDFIHITDVVNIIYLGLLYRAAGITNAASGTSVTYLELAKLVQQILNSPAVTILNLPRKQPITHRLIDVQDMLAAFPGLKLKSLRDGIEATLPSMQNLTA